MCKSIHRLMPTIVDADADAAADDDVDDDLVIFFIIITVFNQLLITTSFKFFFYFFGLLSLPSCFLRALGALEPKGVEDLAVPDKRRYKIAFYPPRLRRVYWSEMGLEIPDINSFGYGLRGIFKGEREEKKNYRLAIKEPSRGSSIRGSSS